MSQFPNSFAGSRSDLDYESRVDTVTLGQFFNMVYAWMCVGLAVTAVVGWFVSHTPALMNLVYASRAGYFVIGLGAFFIAMYVQSQAGRLTVGVSTALFLLYAAIIGALIGGVYLLYPVKTLTMAFVLTGATFGGMSVYGFVTKRDLSRMGSIAIMLLWGFFIASMINFWMRNDALSWIITYGVLILFVGITAYETQVLRQMAMQFGNNREMASRYAIVGSLVLYIAFINMFLSILRILGDRR
jgi:FtsH-binding integral membrane protein